MSSIADDAGTASPEGETSTNLRAPTGYTGLYAAWDDQDVDGDSIAGESTDDDAWDFGDQWQWPVLKFGGLDTARQVALQPNVAPTFTGTVTDKTYRRNVEILTFEVPAATGGEGAGGYTYTATGLPAGLVFEGVCGARRICGTPTTNTTGAQTVTIHAADSDTNTDDSDRAVLTFTITVVEPTAALTSSPAALTEATLNGTELTVTLTDTTFESGVTAGSFTLNTDVVGLTVGSLATVTAGDTSATLTLAYDDTDFDTARTLAVTVAAAAHALPNTVVSPSVPVTPSLEATAVPDTLNLTEATTGGGNVRTFTATLDSVPGATTTVTVASADTGAATVDKAALTFTTTDWNTAQTVTVTAQADDDPNNEEVAVTLSAAGVGVLATVTVNVTDDDLGTVLIDADASTPAQDPGPILLDETSTPICTLCGGYQAYTVRLSTQPTAAATVAISASEANKVWTVSAISGQTLPTVSSLTFTTQNWSTAQTVYAVAVNEADAVDESVTFTHAATGGGYGGTSTVLRVAVTDDERTGTDYDVDNDGLIEVSTLAQLNAIRWDLDGDGSPASNSADYSGASGAFASASTDMGCPRDGCEGYELTQDLDFDTDGDGSTHDSGTSDSDDTYHNSGSGWDPIGANAAPGDTTHFNAVFDGNGYAIYNLYINRNRNWSALFAALRGDAVVRSLGLPNVHVRAGQGSVAPLAGESIGRVEAVWASGSVAGNANVGGLLGQNQAGGVVVASYSKAATQCGTGGASGLVGYNAGTIEASYATGAITGSCAATAKHGLANGPGTALSSHWDRETTGVTTSAQGAGRTTAQLKTPTSATGIFAGWDALDVDGDGSPHESPWSFGTESEYPALRYYPVGRPYGFHLSIQSGDYDADDDGLIEVYTLAQLNAIRWDLNGDGTASTGNVGSYGKAFRNHVAGMGCKSTGCTGYKLWADLDFDTDGDGATWTDDGTFTADSGDAYYNGGSGWDPIGPDSTPSDTTHFTATFDGNGWYIANLLVNRSRNYGGLFAALRPTAEVYALALPNARIRVPSGTYGTIGPLAGQVSGRVAGVWASGRVQGNSNVGGLVGTAQSGSTIVASYATTAVECTGTQASNVAGGLLAQTSGTVAISYSTGTVTGACPTKHGFGGIGAGGAITASYWDTDQSGINDDSDGNPPEGKTSEELRTPIDYVGIYEDWDDQDVDNDGTTGAALDDDDDAWEFGDQFHWPVLGFGSLERSPQFALQPNEPPTFGTATVTNKTYRKDFAIAPFRVPAASGGEFYRVLQHRPHTYSASGLPAGLNFGAPNCTWRWVCGTPTANTAGPQTVTIYAHDIDGNDDDSDRGVLTFTITVVEPTAALTSTPAALTEATLNSAELVVTLTDSTFESGVTTGSFTLNTDVPGLTVGSLATVTAGDTAATLTLAYNDTDFDTNRTLGVTVAAAAHALPGTIVSPTVQVTPSLEATATPNSFNLTEATTGGGNVRAFTVVLDSLPGSDTTVTVASSDAGAASVDVAALTFTTTNWATAQSVTVTAQQDDDPNNETVAVTLAAASIGTLATVTVTVTDDDRGIVLIDADASTPAPDSGPVLLSEAAVGLEAHASCSNCGGYRTYSVRLSARPPTQVAVSVTSSDSTKVTVATFASIPGPLTVLSALTFSQGNWNTAQQVTAVAMGDNDAVDESIVITHTATGGGYGGTSTTLRVGVTDDERTGTDYDTDNDGLIEVSTLAQLNAIRWDLDGDGSPASNAADYSGASGAFASASTDMGCPAVSGTATCTGYELTQDLDFDTDGDGATHDGGTSDSDDTYHNSGSGWDPIGPASSPGDSTHFNATFDGNGHSIHNLYVNRNRNWSALFAALRGDAVVRSLGLPNAHVVGGQGSVAPLAGASWGRVEASWASGSVAGNTNVGGLVGATAASSVIVASYSKASAQCGAGSAGGLVGGNGGTIVASYATGAVTGSCAATNKHGLAGYTGTATLSHWDRETSGVTTSDQGGGRTTAQLKTPTSATGIFAGWADMDVDGDGDPHESPWHFGTNSQYPALRYRGADPIPQRGDYDLDDDGLIDIRTLAQLNAVRWDLDGDGAPASGSAGDYGKAFRNHVATMGCPTSTTDADNNDCTGYELENDLDFDTDGDGATHTGGTSDSGDAYHNGGSGWDPIGPAATVSDSTHFNAVFDGKGKVIRNLYVNRSHRYAGLFGGTASGATVRALGVANAYVEAWNFSGALSGENAGRIAAVWTSGSVQGGSHIGGLAGAATATSTIVASYSTASAQCTGTGTTDLAGGLTGTNAGTIAASYSTGAVTGACPTANKHGLSGGSGTFTASYWDVDRSGISDDAGTASPEGETSANLRAPTGYTALYVDWDAQDVDGDNTAGESPDDDAWDFGDQWQWPVLKFGGLDTALQIAEQPNLPPTFGSGAVTDKTYRRDLQIQPFEIPAATGGEGVGYTYTASGLPMGLSLGAPPCASARHVCGMPTMDTTGAQTVTIYAADGDANTDDSDRAELTFDITVVTPVAALSSVPATLVEATLDGAELVVTLTGTAFTSGVTRSSFTLGTTVPGLTIDSLSTVSAGDVTATLTLAHNGDDFDTPRTLWVTIASGAHDLGGALSTITATVTPSLEATVSPSALALNEDSNHADNARTFTAVLDSDPGGTTTVTVASADTGAATVDKAGADVHHDGLGHRADGDRHGAGGRRREQRNGAGDADGFRRRRAGHGDGDRGGRRPRHRADRRRSDHRGAGPRPAAAGRRRHRRLHGAAVRAAERGRDGGGGQRRHRRGDGGPVLADVHDPELEHGADGDRHGGGGGERLGGRVRDGLPRGHRRRLRRHGLEPARGRLGRRAHRHGLRHGRGRPDRDFDPGAAERGALGPGRQRRGVGRQPRELPGRQRRVRQRLGRHGLPGRHRRHAGVPRLRADPGTWTSTPTATAPPTTAAPATRRTRTTTAAAAGIPSARPPRRATAPTSTRRSTATAIPSTTSSSAATATTAACSRRCAAARWCARWGCRTPT